MDGNFPVTTAYTIAYSDPITIGLSTAFSSPYTGYIDEVRVSNIGRYSGSFTPPTQPFGGGLRMKDPDGKVYALSLSGSA